MTHRTVARASVLVSVLLLAGCGSQGKLSESNPKFVQISYVETAPVITNLGTRLVWVVLTTQRYKITVQANSSAVITATAIGKPTFTSPADKRNWLLAGSPSLPVIPRAGDVERVPRGYFDFLMSRGLILNFERVRALGTKSASVRSSVFSSFTTKPSPAALLRDYGFLLAWAPLKSLTRAAIVRLITTFGHTLENRSGTGTISSATGVNSLTTFVFLSSRHSVENISQRLPRASPLYPFIRPGATVVRDWGFHVKVSGHG